MNNEFIEVPASKKSIGQRKKIFGIAINDAPYITNPRNNGKLQACPYYMVWKSMLQRCFDTKLHSKYPTYLNCTISTEWLLFSTFKSWMEQQNWKGKQLDKDLLITGNKHYSSDTCLFISQELNKLLNENSNRTRTYLLGVTLNKRDGSFTARSCYLGKRFIGNFPTEIEAYNAYCLCKKQIIISIAEQESDVKVKNALINRANLICLVE